MSVGFVLQHNSHCSLFATTPFYALRDAEVKRITNQNGYVVGEQFVSTITIKRKFPFPLLYLVIEDELPPQFISCKQTKMNKVVLFPGLKRNISFQYVIDTIPRGEHTFSSVRVKTGDLFGMIEKEVTFSVPDTFLVYPQYVDIAYRQLENHFEQGALSANINSAKTLQSLSVSETINLVIAFHGLIGKQLHEQTIL